MSDNQIMEQNKLQVVEHGQPEPPVQNKLEGLVAQILSARELIINIGYERGVKPKMHFAVLSKEPLEIRDPETDEVLDRIEREKVRVEAMDIRPKITICKTYRAKTSYLGILGGILSPQPVHETLEAKDSSLPPPLSPEESYVKIGDRVILINDDE
jgi:hypothetical protein